jgi:hypothetical protein
MREVYFVVSLPRTGTKSLCRMAHQCGFNFKHAPINTFNRELKEGKNFFADTPCFVPSFVKRILELPDIDPKFIYIEKEYDKIFESWKKVNLHLNYTRMYNQYSNEKTRSQMHVNMMTDFMSLHESFSEQYMNEENYNELFELHKQKVSSIIKENNKELLMYKFEDGWKPFCDFTKTDIPTSEIPHINIDTMFEKII